MTEQVRSVAIGRFRDDGTFSEALIARLARRVVALRWGDEKTFGNRRMSDVHPFLLRRTVGAGVVLDSGVVLTCAHVLSPPRSVPFPRYGREIARFSRAVRAMTIVPQSGAAMTVDDDQYFGTTVDAAYVWPDHAGLRRLGKLAAGPAIDPGSRADGVSVGTEVCLLHHPGGGPLAISRGRVTGLLRGPKGELNGFEHDAHALKASSGGPLFDARGRLLGLHQGTDDAVSGVVGRAVPLRVIREFTYLNLDPRRPRYPRARPDRRDLPTAPRTRQEVDVGTFEVGNRSGNPMEVRAYCWVSNESPPLHEAWAMNDAFVNAGETASDHLIFKEMQTPWWQTTPGAPELNWEDSTWKAAWKAWTRAQFGNEATIRYAFHTRLLELDPPVP